MLSKLKPPVFYATGRRKSSVAKVFIGHGNGKVRINGRPVESYFPQKAAQEMVWSPLITVGAFRPGARRSYSIMIKVHGGGFSGQAGAIRHGLARALVAVQEQERSPELQDVELLFVPSQSMSELTYRQSLRGKGQGSEHGVSMLTRDARVVERKKYGRRKARKLEQYTKR